MWTWIEVVLISQCGETISWNVKPNTLVYRKYVQDEINVQVGKFLKNIKRAGQNRRARGNFFSKSIKVQTEIKPCRGDFFLKINKLALKKALILHFNGYFNGFWVFLVLSTYQALPFYQNPIKLTFYHQKINNDNKYQYQYQ